MTGRRKPFPYDAFETPDGAGFVLDASPVAGTSPLARVVEGHGVEIGLADGSTLRLGAVHPRLVEACRDRPVAVVAMHDGTWSAAADGDPRDLLVDPFCWYLDAPEGPEWLAARPLARFRAATLPGTLVIAPAAAPSGAPFAACFVAPGLVALSGDRRWLRGHRLVVDADLLRRPPSLPLIDGSVAEGVARALAPASPRIGVPTSRWRSQLAIRIPA